MPSESVTDFGQKGREVEPNRTLSSTLQILDWKKQYGGGGGGGSGFSLGFSLSKIFEKESYKKKEKEILNSY